MSEHRASPTCSRKLRACSLAAGAVAIGMATAAEGALQVFDYRSAPISANVEDNYSVWDHDLAVLHMDGTYKYSTHDGASYTFYDQNGVTTPIDAADKSDDAVWFTHRDFVHGDKGYDGIFLYGGDNGGVGAYAIEGSEGSNPLYRADPFFVDDEVGPGQSYATDGGGMVYGIGGRTDPPAGWQGNQIKTFYLGGDFVGFYLDEPDGRHYGWMQVSTGYRPYGVTVHGWGYETTPYLAAVVTYEPDIVPLIGDFDDDNDVDADDVDMLCAGTDPAVFDLTGDGVVDEDDMVLLVETYLEYDTDGDGVTDGTGTFRGDFNTDGSVNGTDLSIMNGGFGTSVGFAGGNANCDMTVNGTDLSILAGVFGNVATAAVPEPVTVTLLSLGACVPLLRKSRPRCGGRR